MTAYELTLVINREPTEAELQTLGDTDIDATGIVAFETDSGRVLAHVVDDADTLLAAITHAIHQIEALGNFGLQVLGIGSDDLVSLRDIAQRTGRTYESVRLLATGQRGPGGFPSPFSSGQWALYSWAEASAWFAMHYNTDTPLVFDAEMAAADLLIRARRMLADDEHRDQLAALLTA